MSKGHNLLTDHLYVPVCVFTFTILILLSDWGKSRTILANGHLRDGTWSSIKTSVLRSMCLPRVFYLLRRCNSCRYSHCQRNQSCWRSFWRCCHLDNRLSSTRLKDCSADWTKDSPITKWAGVRTWKLAGSLVNGVKGQELRMALTLHSNVRYTLRRRTFPDMNILL